MHLSGVTTLAVKIAPDGHLLSVSTLHSSGVAMIDRAAVASVSAMHFPAFSKAMPTHPITVTLEVKLDSSLP